MLIAVLALIGVFVAGYLLLERVGMIGSLVCGVGGGCEQVQMSRYAEFLGFPVPLLGVVGYASLFAAALAGVQSRFSNDRRLAAILLGLAAVAFGFSLYLTALEAFVILAWCRWCVVSAILSTLIFAFALFEIPGLRAE